MTNFLRVAPKKKLQGKAILRIDLNTEDDWRLYTVLPTIRFLSSHSEKLIIISHKGRPSARISAYGMPHGRDAEKLSLTRDAKKLGRLIGKKVVFVPHFKFDAITEIINALPAKSVVMLENLRFLPGEAKNDILLARSLALLADYYVNEAFSVSHRENASVCAITRYLPSYAGFAFEKEINVLSRTMQRARHPFVVALGGGKASDKLGILKSLKKNADAFLLGGTPANTLLHLRGVDIGKSRYDKESISKLKTVLHYEKFILPVDTRKERGVILDIGPKTEKIFANHIAQARTIIWNGPMGMIEKSRFNKGSFAVARAISRNKKALSVVGGGETVMFLRKNKLEKNFSFVSTGGGAMLEYLGGKKLPGIEALSRKF